MCEIHEKYLCWHPLGIIANKCVNSPGEQAIRYKINDFHACVIDVLTHNERSKCVVDCYGLC